MEKQTNRPGTAIYDCFLFFNEFELLELRLHELAGVVDKFVLVEATKTHSNKPKPLLYLENRARFQQFQDKIIHVVVEDLPDTKDAMKLDTFQRNCIARGLAGCRPDDLVMISDLDEIPRATAVVSARGRMRFRDDLCSKLVHGAVKSPVTNFLCKVPTIRRKVERHHPFILKFEQSLYRYFLNCKSVLPSPTWFGTRMLYFRDYSSAQLIRHSGSQTVENGGWHFSFMGGVQRVLEKLDAFAHQERNIPEYTNPKTLAELIHKGALTFGKGWEFEFVALDNTFPRYILDNPAKFSSWIKPIESRAAEDAQPRDAAQVQLGTRA